jgi:hypothetical protein
MLLHRNSVQGRLCDSDTLFNFSVGTFYSTIETGLVADNVKLLTIRLA